MLPRQASINHSISLGECKLDKLHVRKNTECKCKSLLLFAGFQTNAAQANKHINKNNMFVEPKTAEEQHN